MARSASHGLDRRPCRRLAAIVAAIAAPAAVVDARAGDGRVSTLVFASLDAGPAGFLTAGFKLGLDRIDRQGFAVLASIGAGRRAETGWAPPGSPAPSLMRWSMLGAVLVGHQWFHDWGVVALYGGPEGAMETLSGASGTVAPPVRLGLRVHAELWARPSEETLLAGTLILGSARGDLWGRVSWGIRHRGAYLGPEAALYADETGYRKWSLGLHATDVAILGFRWRASAGCLFEADAGAGPYVTLAFWRPL